MGLGVLYVGTCFPKLGLLGVWGCTGLGAGKIGWAGRLELGGLAGWGLAHGWAGWAR